MNPSKLKVYMEKENKLLPVAIHFSTPQAVAWE